MDSHARRVNYAVRRYGWLPFEASAVVSDAYAGNADLLLTPAQRRRVRHKRGSQPEFSPRGAHPQLVITDELPFTFDASTAMRKMYAALPARGAIRVKQGKTAPGTR